MVIPIRNDHQNKVLLETKERIVEQITTRNCVSAEITVRKADSTDIICSTHTHTLEIYVRNESSAKKSILSSQNQLESHIN